MFSTPLLHRFFVCAVLLGSTLPAAAQAPLPTGSSPQFRWLFGARAGLAYSTYRSSPAPAPGQKRDRTGGHVGPAAGVRVGRYLAPVRGPQVWVVAEPSYEQRRLSISARPDQNFSHLALPLYLRTGRPTTPVHLLLGGGSTWRLGATPRSANDQIIHRRDDFVLLGVEADVLRRQRRALALSAWVRYGVSAA